MDNNGKIAYNAISMGRIIGKELKFVEEMQASYITLTENCTYFDIHKKITILT